MTKGFLFAIMTTKDSSKVHLLTFNSFPPKGGEEGKGETTKDSTEPLLVRPGSDHPLLARRGLRFAKMTEKKGKG